MKTNKLFLLTLLPLLLVGCNKNNSSSKTETSSDIVSSSEVISSSNNDQSSGASSTIESSSSQDASSQEEAMVVSFDTVGGPKYSALKYTGSALKLPTPEYYHHEFLGWYLDDKYTGNPVDKDAFIPTGSVTLYAKWEEVLYLYLYYGASTDNKRISVHPGDVITIADHLAPQDLVIEGNICPFLGWANDITDEEVTSPTVTIGSEDLFLVAKYDMSRAPRAKKIVELSEGVYQSTGKFVWNKQDNAQSSEGYFESKITQTKGNSGASGVICHARIASLDNAYEAGCYYLAATLSPSNGALQMSWVDGSWHHITTIALTSLPLSVKNTFNNAQANEDFSVIMGVSSTANSFSISLNGETAYQCNDIEATTGINYSEYTGFGLRCSSVGSIFSNMSGRTEPIKVTLRSPVFSQDREINYYGGSIPSVNDVENYKVSGWSFDEEGKQKVTLENTSTIKDGTILYGVVSMYSSNALSKKQNGNYEMLSNGVALIGTTSSRNFEINMNINVVKGNGGVGVILGATLKADNCFENDSKYIMAQITGTGGLQFATNDSSRATKFAHIQGADRNGSVSAADMPTDFKNRYSALNAGESTTVKLTVKLVDGKQIIVYVDDTEMCSTNNESLVQSYAGNGYGVRVNNNQCNSEFSYSFEAK